MGAFVDLHLSFTVTEYQITLKMSRTKKKLATEAQRAREKIKDFL